MPCKSVADLLLLGAVLAAGRAGADIPPPPGANERALASMIAAAGYKCDHVGSYGNLDGAAAAPYLARHLDNVLFAVCDGGARYAIATRHPILRAHPPVYDAHGVPIPDPPPEIRPLPQ